MEITKELIDNVTTYQEFKDLNALDDMFIVILNDKILAPKHGTMFHDSYNSAWKHFYSELNWRVKNAYRRLYAEHTGQNYSWRTPTDKTDRQVWEEFKSKIMENNNFKILKWKDAKRNVCSESRV